MAKKGTGNGPGRGKVYVGTSLQNEVIDEIDRRAAALGWSRGKYLREILTRWSEMGGPPISELDKMVQERRGAYGKSGEEDADKKSEEA